MISGLGLSHAEAIDGFVNKHCSAPISFGELEQLRQLFKPAFARALERLLNRTLVRSGATTICDVEFGWIDKIPIAKSSALTKGTELGDAILLAVKEQRDIQGNLVNSTARAAILQAKVARTKAQLTAPTVPIGSGVSTRDELTLLSTWPTFDLKETSGNVTPLLYNVTVAPASLPVPPPHAWFIAAPGFSSKTASGWPSWWMAGPASSGSKCTKTFGTLLVDFLSASPSVGEKFAPQSPTSSSGALSVPPDWSDLCNEVGRILKRHLAPASIFGPGAHKLGPRWPRINSAPFWASALMTVFPQDRDAILSLAAGKLICTLPKRIRKEFAPCWECPPTPLPGEGEGRAFVVLVTVTSIADG